MIFENGDYFSVFKKSKHPHVAHLNGFCPLTRKRRNESASLARRTLYDACPFKRNCVLVPANAVYVLDGILKRRKYIRAKYSDTCERGLNLASANKRDEMQKGRGGGGVADLVFKFCAFLHYSTRVVNNLVPRVFSFCRHIRKREDPGDEIGL